MLWALFDREGPPGGDDEELEGYLRSIEEMLGREIKPGYGPAKPLRLNFDRIHISHRSLMYYLVIGFTDFAASIVLFVLGFSFYRQPRSKLIKSFPIRPLTLLAPKQSASPNFSYFYRPHKSTKHRPIVLVHGVGIGLPAYIPLIRNIPRDIGVLAIEILPISSRITTGMPLFIDLMREVGDIISQQNLQDFVFIGHSYGTFFTKVFLESSYLFSRMHSIVLIDPVAILLHQPDVAYNFFIKEPKEANEVQLWWAAQTEPDIAFTLSRRFCWRDHLLWRDDLMLKPTTVIIGEKDCIINSDAISNYISKGVSTMDTEAITTKQDLSCNWEDREKWKRSIEEWRGEGLELFWMEGYDHGQAFLSPKMLPKLINVFETMSRIGEGDVKTSEDEQNFEFFEPESKPEGDNHGASVKEV